MCTGLRRHLAQLRPQQRPAPQQVILQLPLEPGSALLGRQPPSVVAGGLLWGERGGGFVKVLPYSSLFPHCSPDHFGGGREGKRQGGSRVWQRGHNWPPEDPARLLSVSLLSRAALGRSPLCWLWCASCRIKGCPAGVSGVLFQLSELRRPSTGPPAVSELFLLGQAFLCPPSLRLEAAPLPLLALALFEGRVRGGLWRVAKKKAQGGREKLPNPWRQVAGSSWCFPHDWPRIVTLPIGMGEWPEEQLALCLRAAPLGSSSLPKDLTRGCLLCP